MSNALDFTKIDPARLVVRKIDHAVMRPIPFNLSSIEAMLVWAIGYWYPAEGATRVFCYLALTWTERDADWLLEAIREKLETKERELQQYRNSSSRCINVPLPSGDQEAIREKLRQKQSDAGREALNVHRWPLTEIPE